MSETLQNQITSLVKMITEDYEKGRTIDEIKMFEYPDKSIVIDILEKLKIVIYPGYHRNKNYRTYTVKNNIAILLEDIIYNLSKQIAIVLRYTPEYSEADDEAVACISRKITFDFLHQIPKIREYIETDIQAAYDGDPAAFSKVEIVLSYPAFEAISIYRPAHELYDLGLPLLPRIMTEFAHKKTGIDIHPGATIGKSFFIDHGTGVVIGETCVVGENVKLYQGVTLGAKSFEKDENGNPVKGIKRHPNIGNNVVIYAGATILGGDTYIGDNCVIGGNVWLTHSVDEGCTVYNTVSEGKKIKK
jgi:serine O-acetyltransferase